MLLGFTCKFNKDVSCWKVDLAFIYEKYIERMKSQGIKFLETRYEYDKKQVLHVHALIVMPDTMPYAHFHAICKLEGMHYYKKAITCEAGWLSYMRKDSVPKPPNWSDKMWKFVDKWYQATHPQYFHVPDKSLSWFYAHPDIWLDFMLQSPQQIALDCIKHKLFKLKTHVTIQQANQFASEVC